MCTRGADPTHTFRGKCNKNPAKKTYLPPCTVKAHQKPVQSSVDHHNCGLNMHTSMTWPRSTHSKKEVLN